MFVDLSAWAIADMEQTSIVAAFLWHIAENQMNLFEKRLQAALLFFWYTIFICL